MIQGRRLLFFGLGLFFLVLSSNQKDKNSFNMFRIIQTLTYEYVECIRIQTYVRISKFCGKIPLQNGRLCLYEINIKQLMHANQNNERQRDLEIELPQSMTSQEWFDKKRASARGRSYTLR